MNNDTPANTIAVRALNFLKRDHKPSYIALRYLLGALGDNRRGHWVQAYLERRLYSTRDPTYLRGSMLKSVSQDGKLTHRDFYAPSPTTMLVEADILSELARQQSFKTHTNVYSYRWAKPTSGHLFGYYFDGFSSRNSAIDQALQTTRRAVAVITDVESYYPVIGKGPDPFSIYCEA